MLKTEIEKKKKFNYEKEEKKLESIKLTHQTSNLDHEIKITS
jgi:hypothetical protein